MKVWIMGQNDDLAIECYELGTSGDGRVYANAKVRSGFKARYSRTILGEYASEARAVEAVRDAFRQFRGRSRENGGDFFFEMPKA